MRAIGASPRNIIMQIISESVFLTTFAGYAGMVFGVLLIELIDRNLPPPSGRDTMFLHPTIDFHVAITALTILVIAGALAGLIPARKAVSMKPIDALRYE